ncbi:15099_t:CDS:10 [Acaulospora morrowiae]|uniref:15099_t:CDS:1 n=1 Tax=Acaulospora morrowiae TaxID=94023 RepID=A0A9N8W3G3_9GLOM|nr:15099_t:CDS:10 [Acaulospora morrowiae]
MTTTENHHMLPKNITPFHYDLTFTVDMEEFKFSGKEVIKLDVNEKTNSVKLHANKLEIISAKIVYLVEKLESSQSTRGYEIVTEDAIEIKFLEDEMVIMTFPVLIPAKSKAELHLEYNGELNDDMVGFYRSSYKDDTGVTKYLATTQFEATDARRAFPCWDEPSIKATFDITLIVPSNLIALSNMNVVSEIAYESNKKKVIFATTPKMSTYLVAFVAGELGYIEEETFDIDDNGKAGKIRVYAVNGNEINGAFALEVTKKSLKYYTEIFGMPYPLPKCDLVAIPDTGTGAMENWGLITFNTTQLLFDPNASDSKCKQDVAVTVAHELAHQWFGNIVTMKWWDDLWLNEGFASWLEYFAVAKFFPDWDIWTQFVIEALEQGLELDALENSSHPIQVPVENSNQINQIFDSISYSKGASVIRMLSNSYLGESVFLSGVRKYLNKHIYGNATTDDLWDALSETSGKDVRGFMSNWTTKVGYPVLTIEESTSDSADTSITLKIHQSRCLSIKPNEETDKTIWQVPLEIKVGTKFQTRFMIVLDTRETTLKLPRVESVSHNDDFYLLNPGKIGVFRLNYSPERLKKLGKAVENNFLDVIDCTGLIADSGALATSGYIETSTVLDLISKFENEENYTVWRQINSFLSELLNIFYEDKYDKVYQGLLSFQRKLISKLVEGVSLAFLGTESYLETMQKKLAIKMAGKAGEDRIVEEAFRRFEIFTSNHDDSILNANIRGSVYEMVLTYANTKKNTSKMKEKDIFRSIQNIYENAKTADQKVVAFKGLFFVQDAVLIQDVMKFAISEEVKPQDLDYAFYGLQANRKARRELWNFFKSNWNLASTLIIYDRYKDLHTIFGNLVKGATDAFTSEEDAKEIERFFSDKSTDEIKSPLMQSLERIRTNANWLDRAKEDETKTGGEIVHEALDVLDDLGVKEKLERKLTEHDDDTTEEKAQNTTRITIVINRLDILITVGLYYTSLIMDWLTILGDSTSFGDFLVDLFFRSFVVSQWNFGQLDVVGKISGMTSTLQTGIFMTSLAMVSVAKITKTEKPSYFSGPLYFGGPFQIFHLLSTKASTYSESLQSLDAQISQTIGVLSQLLIIIAASIASPDVTSSYNSNVVDNNSENITIPIDSSANVTLRIRDTALFVSTAHFVSVAAIIMSSMLNIIQYMADIWRVNSDDILVYYVFKGLVKIITCNGCCGGKNAIGVDTTSTRSTPKRPTLTSSNIPGFDPFKPPEIVVEKQDQNPAISRLHRNIETSGVGVLRKPSIRSRSPSPANRRSKRRDTLSVDDTQ